MTIESVDCGFLVNVSERIFLDDVDFLLGLRGAVGSLGRLRGSDGYVRRSGEQGVGSVKGKSLPTGGKIAARERSRLESV